MPPWVFVVALFGVYCLWAVAATMQVAVEDARAGTPDGSRHGVSVLPVIPLYPLLFGALAWLINHHASPWGTVLIGVPHGVFALCLAVSIVRDGFRLRSLNRRP